MWFLHDKKTFQKAYSAFGVLWWAWFGLQVLTAKPTPGPSFSFNCKQLYIYHRERFYKKLNGVAEKVAQHLKIDTDNFKDTPLTSISILGIQKLNPSCKFENISYETKILYYILGIEIYEYIKDLKYGRIVGSTKYNQWEQNILPEQLKLYREFLGLEDKDIEVVEKAYDQLMTERHYP